MDSSATSVTESTEHISLSKTESRQCGPPYPDIAECMNDGSLHSDIAKKSLLTEKWNSYFDYQSQWGSVTKLKRSNLLSTACFLIFI